MNLQHWKVLIAVASVTALFILLFQPFSIKHHGDLVYIVAIAGYGFVGALALYINELISVRIVKVTSSKNLHLITRFAVGSILVPAFIFLYKNILSGFKDFSFYGFSIVFYRTVLIATFIFPIVYLIQKKKDNKIRKVVLESESKGEKIIVAPEEIVLLESASNYVFVYLLNNNNVQKRLIRNNLKKLEKEMAATSLFRVHRSYIVNMIHVIFYEKKGEVFNLHLSSTDQIIPVSRKYKSRVVNFFSNH